MQSPAVMKDLIRGNQITRVMKDQKLSLGKGNEIIQIKSKGEEFHLEEWEKFVDENEHILEMVYKRRRESQGTVDQGRDKAGKNLGKVTDPGVGLNPKKSGLVITGEKVRLVILIKEFRLFKSPSETTLYSRAIDSSTSEDSSDNSFQKMGIERLS